MKPTTPTKPHLTATALTVIPAAKPFSGRSS
jgi:hypothetical protein